MRWTYKHKAEVVERVSRGNISRAEALARYGLSEAELAEWERRFAEGGAGALKARASASLRLSLSALRLSARAFKITIVLDPSELAGLRVPDGVDRVEFVVSTPDGQSVSGKLNPKTARRAIGRISELGADKVSVILRGQLQGRRLESAGLAVQRAA